ncbi:MAG TPA: inorganic phosphate transporter [Terriglobales bacterium]|nr:inorganic phosphate transporter [Terriglobales bacterium]
MQTGARGQTCTIARHEKPYNLNIVAVVLIGAFLAYTNGANDVSKGIATLAGSGVSSYRRAILWGALWTTCGGVAAFALSRALVTTFGKGLFSAGVTPTLYAALATLIGAGLWVGLATRWALPVSTTHAIVGSIAGVAVIAYGPGGMNWTVLTGKVALPLLLSPVVSLVISAGILRIWNFLSPSGADCLCAEIVEQRPLAATASGELVVSSVIPALTVFTCGEDVPSTPSTRTLSVKFDHLHWITSAGASFSRGLNDAPKMVAIGLAATTISGLVLPSSFLAYLVIAAGILAGSLQGGRRVTTVLAEKITPMNHREGFAANLVTSLLVGPGAFLGLPMSTTHVSTGAIIGIGIHEGGTVDWKRVKDLVLAWIVTLPAAALLGVLAYGLLCGVFRTQ